MDQQDILKIDLRDGVFLIRIVLSSRADCYNELSDDYGSTKQEGEATCFPLLLLLLNVLEN